MTAAIEARGLRYEADGNLVLAGLDFEVAAGEKLAVIGPSGSGKTTLLALLGGLERPTEGEVRIGGRRLEGLAGPERGVAVVLQGYGLVSLLTASENVEIAVRALGGSPSEARTAAADALSAVGLSAHAGQLVEELSGGQQQRVAVARALVQQPRVLLADEPTAELDAKIRILVLARMLEVTDHGAALVLATHDPEVASKCDRTLDLRAVGA